MCTEIAPQHKPTMYPFNFFGDKACERFESSIDSDDPSLRVKQGQAQRDLIQEIQEFNGSLEETSHERVCRHER